MWSRVFGRSEVEPPPEELAAALDGPQPGTVRVDFRGDELGWSSASVRLPGSGGPVVVDRYLADEDDIRRELNSWAAWLETADYCPDNVRLMEMVIQSRQLFAVRRPIDHADEVTLDRVCQAACRFLAERTDGIFQTDGQGFFDASGALLLQEY